LNEPGPSSLAKELDERIGASGPLPFRDFFELALYHPKHGYYTRPSAVTGREGDFSTSPDVSPAFGRRLAVQVDDVHGRLGGGTWQLVELGPGRGLLVGDVWDGLKRHAPAAAERLEEIVLVEVSPALEAEQRRRLAERSDLPPVRWVISLEELETGSLSGAILGNEVLDALPVHAVVRREDGLRELFVDRDEAAGAFRFVERAPSRPELVDLADRYGLCPRVGQRAEICLELPRLLGELARVLGRGAALLVDYGHPADRLGDDAHGAGTLLAYHRHRVVEDVLARPGEQDITAHVNWTHLEEAARKAGWSVAGRTYQDRFLLALGIVEDMAHDPEGGEESPGEAAYRLSARSLVLPAGGGGRRFEVVCLVKGIDPRLQGLGDPYAALYR
jgi:SAM-dependent MidA family methyltransferase